jgi:hypothetical protein
MNLEDYKKELLTFDLVKINLYGIFAFIPVTIVYGIPYYYLWHQTLTIKLLKKVVITNKLTDYNFLVSFFILIIIVTGIMLHELIHGFTFSFFAKNGFKSIKFGVIWKVLTPYCHCDEPLSVRQYIIGAIMPTIILGFFPFFYSLIFGNLFLLIFAFFFTIAAIGDFIIIFMLRNEDKNSMVLDHPSEIGCFIYRKIIN